MSTSGDSTNLLLNESYLIPEEDDMEADDGSDDDSGSDMSKMLREQDRFLPICNIIKIMKRAIPDNGKVAKDARECIQECVSEFISFITSEAIDRSHGENRKTVNGDDLLYAFSALGFDNYVEPLTLYLHKYRESTKSDRNIIYQDTIFYEDSDDFKPQLNGLVSNNLVETSTNNLNNDSVLFYQTNQSGNFNL